MNPNNQITRVLNMLYKLLTSEAGITLQGLRLEFKVHPKTLRRDLKAIAGSGFGLVSTILKGKKLYKSPTLLSHQIDRPTKE